MKTLRFSIFGLLAMTALVCRAQITEPGWYRSTYVPPNGSGALEADSQDIGPMDLSGSPNIAEAITPDIQALARGLENDPTRIFAYVHDHIRPVLYYGSTKGAQLTLLERSGNDFDQCALLVALLQAAGYTNVGYQFGMLKMPYDGSDHNDLHHWLRLSLVNTNAANTSNYFNVLLLNRGYPMLPNNNAFYPIDANTFEFQRFWVVLTNNSTVYYLDPAFKISEPVPGIGLASAMGFDSNAVMTAVGGNSTADYVTGLNEAALRSTLQTYNNNLLTTLQSDYPNASVQQILGGWQIVPWTNGLSQSLPFPTDTRGGLFPIQSWTSEPTNFMSTFAISIGSTNHQWYFPQLQGQRLSLTFSNNGTGQLWLGDSLVLQTNLTGGSVTVTLTAKHPYGGWNTGSNIPIDTGWSDASVPNSYQATNASYAIMYGFEPDPAWLLEREQQLDTYRQQGYSDTSRQVVTETLNVMGLNFLVQTKLYEDLLAPQVGVLPAYFERLGRMAQESGNGYYIDVYFQQDQAIADGGIASSNYLIFSPQSDQFSEVGVYFESALEHGLIEQLQSSNLVAASTVKILELANSNNQTIYLATSNNWTSGVNVQGKLVNYNTSYLGSLINQGYILLLPTNGSVRIGGTGSWAGTGYVEQYWTTYSHFSGMIIGGAHYNGGFAEYPSLVPNPAVISGLSYANPLYVDPASVFTPVTFSADPVNMADASFDISATDLSLGQAEPLGMTLSRNYTPARRHVNLANMANGWMHSYYFNLATVSAPMASLGQTTPAQMAPMLVANCAALNLYSPQPDPKGWVVKALVAKWGIDQTISNAVSITLGPDTMQFIRQPGGAYTPPANCTWTLTDNPNYTLQQRHGNAFLFNNSRQLTSITNQSGDTLSLTYTGTNLTKVTDWKNRTLTFTYSGTPSRLTQVADSSGRTVKFGYATNPFDTNLDLVSVTDPDNNTSSFLYDTNHQLTATFDALGRLVVSNVYDSLGHVTTQYTQGDINKAWQIYWSGWETVSQDPAGNKQRYFYDDQTRLIGQQDALGNLSQMVYDGQDHVIMTVSPLGETNQSVYDANNNLLYSVDALGFTNQFVYDSQNNLIKIIDPRGNPSTFGYNSRFLLTGQTNGAGDWVNFDYNSDGTLKTRTDAGGQTKYDNYDQYGQLTHITYPNNDTESFANSPLGDVTSHTDGNGNITTLYYNNRRELTNTIAPTNLTTSVAYDPNNNVASTTDARRNPTTNTWSATRHLLTTTLPTVPAGTPVLTSVYDNRDWLAETLDPYQAPTLYTNNVASWLVSQTDPLQRTTTFSYDNDGRKISTTNPSQEITRQTWDAKGELIALTDGAQHTSSRAYDGAGNQIILTNRNGKVWQFQFDGANRLTNTIPPSPMQPSSQTWSHQGLLSSATDPAHQTTYLYYDGKARLTNRTDNVGTVLYGFDANGNRTSVAGNGLTNAWTYDAYNRVSTYKDAYGNLIQYKYDANGNLTNLVYPGGKNVFYTFDADNHLTQVKDWSERITTFQYDLAGRLTEITRPNGTFRTLSYDSAGEVTNIWEQMANGLPIAWFRYNWNPNSTMNWEFAAPLPHTNSPPTRTMYYNADNELATFQGPTMGSPQNVTEDGDGNLTYGPLTNDNFVTYTFDARNCLHDVGGVTNSCDAMNNRIGQSYGTNTVSFVVNPNAKLPQVLERVKNGVTTYYIYGMGLLYQITETATSTNTLTYHFDCRGSTIALTDDSGIVRDRFEYSLYAALTYRAGTDDTPFLFNGRYGVQSDSNGLLFMLNRYYNPYICRFLSQDPSGFSGGLNFYAYANLNPVSYLDPFGLGAIGDNPAGWVQKWTDQNFPPTGQPGVDLSPAWVDNTFEAMLRTDVAVATALNEVDNIITIETGGLNHTAGGQMVMGAAAMFVPELRGEGMTAEGTMAVSPYRYTSPGDVFYHYGYAEDAAGFQGGLHPGGFATSSGNLSGSDALSGLALRRPTAPPNAVYTVTPTPGTPIRVNPVTWPNFGQPGGLPEYQFPGGTLPGTVSGPMPIPPQ